MIIDASSPTSVGLTRREAERWSLVRVVNGIEADPLRMPGAEFEREASDQIARRLGRPAHMGFVYVPFEVQQRTLVASTGAGSNLVGAATFAPGASFASSLRGQDPLLAFGVERVGPLVGNFALPRVGTGASASWLNDETSAANDSQPVYGQQAAAPKTVASFFKFTRSLEKSVPPPVLEALVINESARTLASAVAAAFVAGAGTGGQPTGLIKVSGVFSQSGTALGNAGIVAMLEAVESAGLADPARAGFVVGPTAAKLLRTREVATGAGPILRDNMIAGYRAIVTAAAPTDAILFGDMSRAAIGEWGVLEVGADPFTSFQSAIVGVRAIYSCDILCLAPAAFAKSESIT